MSARARAAFSAGALLLLANCAHKDVGPGKSMVRTAARLPQLGQVTAGPQQLAGKVVLINFFATWCFPCVVETAELVRLQGTYERRGFSVLAIGMDEQGALVLEPFVRQYRLNYPVAVADDEVLGGTSVFGRIQKLPTTFLLGREGKVVAAWAGVASPKELEALIEREVSEGE